MADNPAGPAAQDPAQTTQGDNQASPELAAARAELARTKQQYDELRRFSTRAATENAELKRRAQQATQQADFSEPDASSAYVARLQRVEEQNAALLAEVGEAKFKADNPDWREYWPEIEVILADPVRVREIATHSQGGAPDVYRSLSFAKMQLQNAHARKILDAQKEHQGKSAAEVERQKKQATISGTTASAPAGTISESDFLKMTPDEMIKSGALKDVMDPNDPLRLSGKK